MTISGIARIGLLMSGALVVAACNPAPEPAYIPPPPPPDQSTIWAHDADRDGTIDRAEWKASGDSIHAKLDANGDGAVTEIEVRESFDLLDTDGDGVLSKREMYVDELDKDRNAQISRSEWVEGSIHPVFDVNGDGVVSNEELQMRRGEKFAVNDENDNGRLSDLEISGDNVELFSF